MDYNTPTGILDRTGIDVFDEAVGDREYGERIKEVLWDVYAFREAGTYDTQRFVAMLKNAVDVYYPRYEHMFKAFEDIDIHDFTKETTHTQTTEGEDRPQTAPDGQRYLSSRSVSTGVSVSEFGVGLERALMVYEGAYDPYQAFVEEHNIRILFRSFPSHVRL